MGLILVLVAFTAAFFARGRSLGAGLAVVLTVGYVYGMVRAVVFDGFSHFMFDAAMAGLYVSHFSRPDAWAPPPGAKPLFQWAVCLMGWPFVALLIGLALPVHPLIQLVGLRAAVWFLPFLLMGVQLTPRDVTAITRTLAVLNLVALAFGVGEYVLGIEAFLPRNAATALIYQSKDVGAFQYHRIPSTFVASAAYGGVMVATCPLLAGRWTTSGLPLWEKVLLTAALFAAAVGVFLCGSRTPVVLMLVLAAYTVYQLKLRLGYLALVVVLGVGVAYVVSGSQRLQRFTTLEDTEEVSGRIQGSVNVGVLDLFIDYPLGAGLGSAFGTSVPSFLRHLAPESIGAENEYARIGVEQGLVGVCLWVSFLVWFFTRRAASRAASAQLSYRLCRLFLLLAWGGACLGTGMLTSIPGTCLVLLFMGWVVRCNGQGTGATPPDSQDRGRGATALPARATVRGLLPASET
jgi:hypothetical protein